ncbi:hypothetical protein BgiMline_015415, partial [Biomphalaria glabrata]
MARSESYLLLVTVPVTNVARARHAPFITPESPSIFTSAYVNGVLKNLKKVAMVM